MSSYSQELESPVQEVAQNPSRVVMLQGLQHHIPILIQLVLSLPTLVQADHAMQQLHLLRLSNFEVL